LDSETLWPACGTVSRLRCLLGLYQGAWTVGQTAQQSGVGLHDEQRMLWRQLRTGQLTSLQPRTRVTWSTTPKPCPLGTMHCVVHHRAVLSKHRSVHARNTSGAYVWLLVCSIKLNGLHPSPCKHTARWVNRVHTLNPVVPSNK